MSKRIDYWDNMKAVLIFLVVLGHVILPVRENNDVLSVLFYTIYLFHMPAFVFVAGFFSKNYVKKGTHNVNKLFGFVGLYIIFKLILYTIDLGLGHDDVVFSLFYEPGAPWYLLAMFWWYVLLPLFAKLRRPVCIIITTVLALLIGVEDGIDSTLVMSRTLIYFPFFMLGYYFDGSIINKIGNKAKVIGTMGIVAVVAVVAYAKDAILYVEPMIFGDKGYFMVEDKVEIGQPILIRFILMITALAMIALVMLVIPKRKTVVSTIGRRTLSIYIVHKILLEILKEYHIYDTIQLSGWTLVIFCLTASVILTFVSGLKIFDVSINKIFKLGKNAKIEKGDQYEKNKRYSTGV